MRDLVQQCEGRMKPHESVWNLHDQHGGDVIATSGKRKYSKTKFNKRDDPKRKLT
jgi:hypothetical protein